MLPHQPVNVIFGYGSLISTASRKRHIVGGLRLYSHLERPLAVRLHRARSATAIWTAQQRYPYR
jgi:hypothetical protein